MRLVMSATAFLFAALATFGEEPAITLVRASKAHGKLFRTETITAKAGEKKATLTIEVAETMDAKPQTTECDLPTATFEALVRFVRHRGLDSWDAATGIAYDWGDESYAIEGVVKHGAHWTGPLAPSAPPHALFRMLGDLAKTYAPKIELKWFAGVGEVTGRIRAFGTWGGPRLSNAGGAQDLEIEVEAREGSWTITVRHGNLEKKPAVAEVAKALTREEWETLSKAVTDSGFAEWDETKVQGMPDWGTVGIEIEIAGKGVQKLWHGAESDDVPGHVVWHAIERLAKAKDLDIERK